MAIQLLGAPPKNTYASRGSATAAGLESVGENIGGAIGAYRQAKKERELEALKKLLLQTELTGTRPPITPELTNRLKSYFGKDFDPSTIKASETGRKIAGLQADAASMGVELNPDDIKSAYQAQFNKSLGLRSPQAMQADASKLLSAHLKNYKDIGVDHMPPPESLKKLFKLAHGGEEWPTKPMLDPATGQPILDNNGQPKTMDLPVGEGPAAKERQDNQKVINDAMKLSLQTDMYGNKKVSPDNIYWVVSSEFANKYGPQWYRERPDLLQAVYRSMDSLNIPHPPMVGNGPFVPGPGGSFIDASGAGAEVMPGAEVPRAIVEAAMQARPQPEMAVPPPALPELPNAIPLPAQESDPIVRKGRDETTGKRVGMTKSGKIVPLE